MLDGDPDIMDLVMIFKGPDFPTGCILV
jgi:DNA gyrase/topoisomerase IV subunit A